MSYETEPQKVLVVDDDPDIRELVEMALEMDGFKTLGAKNGQEALEVAEREQPDAIISDIQMPVMDGAEFRERMFPRKDFTPFVAMTAGGDSPEAIRLCDHEGEGLVKLHKPFENLEVIPDAVRNAVKVQKETLRANLPQSANITNITDLLGTDNSLPMAA